MPIFGELERFISEDLYPYRWPLTIAAIVLAAAILVLAYRLKWHVIAWRHKAFSAAAIVLVLAAGIPLGNYLLSPLWERSFLEERSPLALAPAATITVQPMGEATPPATESQVPGGGATPAEPFEARVTHEGNISGADDFHFGRGKALLIETAPDSYTLRLEEFSVRNGPDLFVYLTNDPGSVDGAINLGELKATDGAFNYELPAGVDPTKYEYAIVWCKQFAVLFASAPLTPQAA